MKILGTLILFMSFGIAVMAQDDAKMTTTPPEPTFVGGQDGLIKHIAENVKYPQTAIDKKIQGTVYTAITVDELGKVVDVRVLRGVSEELDQEAIRIVKTMSNWIPGKDAEGKPVMARCTLPIRFALD